MEVAVTADEIYKTEFFFDKGITCIHKDQSQIRILGYQPVM